VISISRTRPAVERDRIARLAAVAEEGGAVASALTIAVSAR